MVIGREKAEGYLGTSEVRELVLTALERTDLDNRRVLLILPDLTRNAPVPLLFRLLADALTPRVKKLDAIIALGTHRPLAVEQIAERIGVTSTELAGRYRGMSFFNHAYDRPEQLAEIGALAADEVREISGGLLSEEAVVTVNKRVFDYDHLIAISPVVPHEVAGFSGGNKYLFPGIAGADFIHFFHWLAAVITNLALNGIKDNPVRRILDRAASFISIPRLFLNLVIHQGRIRGLFIGDDEEAWGRAADLSSKVHIRYIDRAYDRVLGVAPPYYDDLWVAGKVMYKLEPVIADGGELIIFAPHISEISYTHGPLLRKIGYHVRDYYLAQMERFAHIPRGVLAHSTHVKGAGTYRAGLEQPRVKVVLATAIPEDVCRLVNLGYCDHRTIEVEEWRNRENEGVLLVEKAGEVLYRLQPSCT